MVFLFKEIIVVVYKELLFCKSNFIVFFLFKDVYFDILDDSIIEILG